MPSHTLSSGRGRMWYRLAVLTSGRIDLVLQECLAQTSHVPMAEDPERPSDKPLLGPIPLAVLVGKKTDQSLAHGQPDRALSGSRGVVAHWASLDVLAGWVIGSRGSTTWLSHVSRIQWWAGSSVISQVPSAAGPAITLR